MSTVVQKPTLVWYSGATLSALSISFASNVTPGNAVIVAAAPLRYSSYSLSSVTDNQSGNTYTTNLSATQGPAGGSYSALGVGWCTGVNASGTFTISVNLNSSGSTDGHIGAIEVSDIVDQAEEAVGANFASGGTSLTVNTSGSTTSAACFVVAVAHLFDGWAAVTVTGPTSSYTSQYAVNPTGSVGGYSFGTKSVSATGVQSGAWSFNTNTDHAHGVVIAFKEMVWQYSDPSSTLYNSDGWQKIGGGTTDPHLTVDEGATPNDSDGVESAESPSNDVIVFGMSDLSGSTPTEARGSIRYKKSATAGDTISLIAQWRKGYVNEGTPGTLVATLLNNTDISGTITQVDYDLTSGERSAIDMSDIVLRIVANKEANVPTMPSLRAAGTGGASNANGTPITPGLPSGWQAGDIHFLLVMTNAATTWTDLSANWTEISSFSQNNAAQSTKLYWRRAVGGDTAPSISYVSGTALGTSNGLYGRIYGFKDCITSGTPFEDDTSGGVTSTDTTPDTLEITTTGAQELAVNFCAIDDDTAFSSGNPPTNWSNLVADYTSTTGGDTRLNVMGRQMAAAGTVGAVVVGTLSTGEMWRSCTLALLPQPQPRKAQVTWARFRAPEATGPVTHACTGALSAQAATIAGTAQHKARHTTTGALSAQAAAVAGTAKRFRAHTTTGALSAQAAAVAGTARRFRTHATTGALTAQAAAIAGTAARTRAHATTGALLAAAAIVAGVASSATPRPSTGALNAQAATVVGTAARASGAVTHTTTGTLTAQAAAVAGTAARTRAHTTTGTLTAQTAAVAGTASSKTTRTATGALVAQAATVAGTASSATTRPSTGTLSAQAATVAGTAVRFTGATTHPTSGTLTAQAAALAGTAARTRTHPTTGALSAQAAALAGTAQHRVRHTSTGALTAQAAAIAGTASSKTTRTATGALSAQAASITGSVTRFKAHPTTAALTAQAAAVAGTAARTRAHTTTGTLTAQPATIAGAASSKTARPSTGALVAQPATIAGAASRGTSEVLRLTWTQLEVPSTADADKLNLTWTQLSVPPAEYNVLTAAGALVARPATVAGAASSATPRPATGALTAGPASVSGTARHYRTYTTAGMLVAQSAQLSGTARRYRTLRSTGALAGQSAQVAGTALSYTLHLTTGSLQAAAASIAGHATVVIFHRTTGVLAAQPARLAATALRLYQGQFNESPYQFETPLEPVDVEPPSGLRETPIPAENRRLLIPIEWVEETPRLMLVMPEQRKLTVAIQADRPAETP